MQHIAYDTEFLEDGSTIMPISIGLVASDGREYYAVNADMDQFAVQRRTWLFENVWPHLPTVDRERDLNRPNAWREPHATQLDMSAACVKPKWVIANEVRDFILRYTKFDPKFNTGNITWGCDPGMKAIPQWEQPPKLWAYYGAYDHVMLAQLYGQMIDLPEGIPMFTHEIRQLVDDTDQLPVPPVAAHNALNDARWNMMVLHQLGIAVHQQPGKLTEES